MITGGSGFIGTNLVDHFISKGHEVINIDIAEPRNKSHLIFWHNIDILNLSDLQSSIKSFMPDIIFHMAARTDLEGHNVSDYQANTVGVKNLLIAINGSHSLSRVIFASSRLVCRIGYIPKNDNDYLPNTPYGESKVIGEKFVKKFAPKINCVTIIVRPTSIWGPWFEIPYRDFFLSIASGRYVHPGFSEIYKSFGFVGNTIYQLTKLAEAPNDLVNHKIFYLADHCPISVHDMANTIQRTLGVRRIRTIPVAMLRPIAWIGDCLRVLGWHNPPLTSFRLRNLLTPMVYDLDNLKDIAGELPYSMEEGVKITINWLQSSKEILKC